MFYTTKQAEDQSLFVTMISKYYALSNKREVVWLSAAILKYHPCKVAQDFLLDSGTVETVAQHWSSGSAGIPHGNQLAAVCPDLRVSPGF